MDDDSYPPPLKVGIAYNLKKEEKDGPSAAEDMEAEFDSFETIRAIRDVFRSAGVDTALLEADADFVGKVKSAGVNLVFNIAEGKNGRGREAQVPAILSFLGIPYSGSDETTLGIALDKAMTKRYLSSYGVRTPAFCLAESPDFRPGPGLRYPLIVKPNSEGSGKGITDLAVVENEARLAQTLRRNFELYGEPMLVEEYVRGREFTVGLLGNGGGLAVFEPMEILYRGGDAANGVYSYRVKTGYKDYVDYRCPAELDRAGSEEMKKTAALICGALGCRDFSRIDFRLSEDGTLYFIEINPLPGLAPGYSDYPMLAQFCGVDYRTLILGVLQSALGRYGMDLGARKRGDLR